MVTSFDVVIVTCNSGRHIGPCIESICAAGAKPIVVDNGSADDTLEIVRMKSAGTAQIIPTGQNLGYGKAINLGFKESTSEFVVLSNPDVVYLENSIEHMADFLKSHPAVGIAGVQEIFPDGSWQRSYGDLPGVWSGIKDAIGVTTLHNQIRRAAWPRKIDRRPKEVPYVDGAVLMVRREAFEQADGFDEDFYFYADESDLCARLKKMGWRVMFLPDVQVIHIRGADSAKVDRSERFLRFMVKSQYLLANTHLPPWKAGIYVRMQICHFVRLRLIYRVVQLFSRDKSRTAYKLWMFDGYARLWKEFAKEPVLPRVSAIERKGPSAAGMNANSGMNAN